METGIVMGRMVGTDMVVTVVDFEMDENSVHSDWNWVDDTEHYKDVEVVAYIAQDQTDSTKDLDGSAIPDCMCWSMEVWWMLHSCSPDMIEADT